MHWEALLKEVLQQKKCARIVGEFASNVADKPSSSKNKIEYKKFFLGSDYGNIYFTSREAQVMIQLIHGKTISAAAVILNLSPRTIEFYVKNMKTKLSCRTKSELIGKVFASDFIRNLDFITRANS